MSIYLSLDEKMAEMWNSLSPHFNVIGMSEPLKLTDNLKLPKPFLSTVGVWLADEEGEVTQ